MAGPVLVFPASAEGVQPVPAETRGRRRPPIASAAPSAPATAGRRADFRLYGRGFRPVGAGVAAPRRAKGARKAAEALIAAAARRAAPAVASRAPRRRRPPSIASSIVSPSLWAPPTTWTRTSGLRATKAAARSGSTPRQAAIRADERGQAEHRERRDRLQHRDRDADREPGERIGEEREERAVGAGRFGPGDVGEGGVGGRRQRRVDVGVEPVHDPQPRVVDVAEDVVGEQDRRQREGGDEDDDRSPDEARARARGAATSTPR